MNPTTSKFREALADTNVGCIFSILIDDARTLVNATAKAGFGEMGIDRYGEIDAEDWLANKLLGLINETTLDKLASDYQDFVESQPRAHTFEDEADRLYQESREG